MQKLLKSGALEQLDWLVYRMQCWSSISTSRVVRSLSFFTAVSFLSTNVELASKKVDELKVHNRNPIAATDVNRPKIVEC